jgi:HPt (histidine-containing phosphotransfer) domain-containing protein
MVEPLMISVIDAQTFADLRDDGDDLLIDLIDLFFSETPEQMRVLVAALEDGGREQVERSAHTLKSTAATFGAEAMRAVAAEAEMAARKGQLERVAHLLPTLQREADQVRAALAVVRARLATS